MEDAATIVFLFATSLFMASVAGIIYLILSYNRRDMDDKDE